jgi:GT2 family glycosyltransferase
MTGAGPVVSVCIANFNGMEVIGPCLDSVQAQDCEFAVEIIVHDDASSDGSAAYIHSRYPQVKLIQSSENAGFCIANNRMAAAAQGEYLLFLNNDAALFPDALRTLHEAATRTTAAAILGLRQYAAATGTLIDQGSRFDPFLNPVPNLDPERRDVGMVIGACLWIPRPLWRELGGFPEWFGSMAEDMYLCCAARLRGYQVQALPESGFRHWVGKSFGGGKILADRRLATTVKRRALSETNKSFVMALTYPGPLFQLLLPLHLLLLTAEGLVLTLVKGDAGLWRAIYWRCLKALWTEQGRLRGLRTRMQAERRIGRFAFFSVFGILPHKLRMLVRHGLPEVH